MTATHQHEAGLKKLRELAPDTVFVGGTTCQGVLTPQGSIRNNHHVVAIWAVDDDEGHYQVGMIPYDDVETKHMEMHVAKLGRKYFHQTQESLLNRNMRNMGEPSFVWVTSAPGPE